MATARKTSSRTRKYPESPSDRRSRQERNAKRGPGSSTSGYPASAPAGRGSRDMPYPRSMGALRTAAEKAGAPGKYDRPSTQRMYRSITTTKPSSSPKPKSNYPAASSSTKRRSTKR